MTNPQAIADGLSEAEKLQCLDPTKRGHVTRYSDSSLYDEICIFCRRTDGMPMLGNPDTLTAFDCETGLSVRAILAKEGK